MFEKVVESVFSQGEEMPRLWLHLQVADTDEQVLQANMITISLICHENPSVIDKIFEEKNTKYFQAQEFVR